MTRKSGELVGGRYRLMESVGQGGMGQVWRGRDEVLDREVAVKLVLLPQGVSAEERATLISRVLREARAAARLNHPGIVTIHDVVEHMGAPAIVMELLTGASLAAAITREGRLPADRVARIGITLVEALTAAHTAGIVHRDLKPDNVLLAGKRTIITDFGIAGMADATALTAPGTIMGTPQYMAPEQIEGRPVPASDLWSLARPSMPQSKVNPPFDGPTLTATLTAILTQQPRPPRHAGPLAPMLFALLRKEPERRATVEDTGRALTRALAVLQQLADPASPSSAPPPPGADSTPRTVPASAGTMARTGLPEAAAGSPSPGAGSGSPPAEHLGSRQTDGRIRSTVEDAVQAIGGALSRGDDFSVRIVTSELTPSQGETAFDELCRRFGVDPRRPDIKIKRRRGRDVSLVDRLSRLSCSDTGAPCELWAYCPVKAPDDPRALLTGHEEEIAIVACWTGEYMADLLDAYIRFFPDGAYTLSGRPTADLNKWLQTLSVQSWTGEHRRSERSWAAEQRQKDAALRYRAAIAAKVETHEVTPVTLPPPPTPLVEPPEAE